MQNAAHKPSTVDEYIAQFPDSVQKVLEQIRKAVFWAAPDAVEQLSYGMPGYMYLGKPLVYFAAHRHHVGFYATPEAQKVFVEELKGYKQGKGSVQFPYNTQFPVDIVIAMVRFKCFAIENGKK